MVKVGSILQIPLPDNRFAFGKLYQDSCIAIYEEIAASPNSIPQEEKFQFIVGVYSDVLASWAVVDFKPFACEADSWPPPMYILDPISGEYSIYYQGESIPSTKEQCKDLEEAAVWDVHHIIDRIMGEDKWQNL